MEYQLDSLIALLRATHHHLLQQIDRWMAVITDLTQLLAVCNVPPNCL